MKLHGIARLGLAAAIVTLAAATPARAQRGDGFLFRQPEVNVSLRLGYGYAMANSDLFKQVTEDLTLNKRDFSGLTAGAEIGVPITSRFEFTLDGAYVRANKSSEFRHFIDNNDLPIEQTTTFERVPLSANLRFYLAAPGRSVGKLAWIPAKIVPWVSGGGGTMWYRFQQRGDFVDFNTSNVYPSYYEGSGWAPVVQASGGVDVSLNSLVAFRTSLQSIWAKGPLGRDFSGFDKLDLSGVNATLGLSFRL
jgi:hypothetical protein